MSKGGKFLIGIVAFILVVGAASGAWIALFNRDVSYEGLLTHTVRFEPLQLTIVERGFLESANNEDIICRVKSGAKGSTVATTIKWLIDDGTYVQAGDKLMELDDSGLQEQLKAQKIVLDSAEANWIQAKEQYEIDESENQSNIQKAQVELIRAKLALEMYLGGVLSKEQGLSMLGTLDSAGALFTCSALAADISPEKRYGGEYQKLKKEAEGKRLLARSDLEMWEERAGWSKRMFKRGYVTASQVQADEAKLQSARLALQNAEEELRLLKNYTYQERKLVLTSGVEGEKLGVTQAEQALIRAIKQAKAMLAQSDALRKAQESIYRQELANYQEIEREIRKCVIRAPQAGLVVYHIPEQSRRGGGSQQSIVAQGEPVREGQKLMQIPDLTNMLVKVNVHEALVSRLRGDERVRTGFSDAIRAALQIAPLGPKDPFASLINNRAFSEIRSSFVQNYSDEEQRIARKGLPAKVRVEAFSSKMLGGRVTSVATLASQQDFLTADVRVYETKVSIEKGVEGLKPGMTAEVTIYTDAHRDHVLTVPLQAIFGGVQMGNKRKCFVLTAKGPVEREIDVGISNETKAEVKSGLREGEQVVINPRRVVEAQGGSLGTPSGTSNEPGRGRPEDQGRPGGDQGGGRPPGQGPRGGGGAGRPG
jgi:HlyD family secretion protein